MININFSLESLTIGVGRCEVGVGEERVGILRSIMSIWKISKLTQLITVYHIFIEGKVLLIIILL